MKYSCMLNSRAAHRSLLRFTLLVTLLTGALTACSSELEEASQTPDKRLSTLAGESPNYLSSPSDSAEVSVVEFIDYQCPPCSIVGPELERLSAKYEGSVNFVARNLPLSIHPNSVAAALSAEAAANQGHFKEMYSRLFETQDQWSSMSVEDAALAFRAMALELDLDMDAWDSSINDPGTKARIEADEKAAEELGVPGTPTVFVAGKQIHLSSLEDLEKAIEAALALDHH